MRAAMYNGPHSINVGERPDPVIMAPTDAVVRVVLSCVCGSDLWYYRGESPHDLGPIGHEFIGVVERVGPEVRGIAKGDSSSRRSCFATAHAQIAALELPLSAWSGAGLATTGSTAVRARQ
jgi:threonine dehydrogenase-like Zn-dependent dehydrogenase